jgi:preprotein translocase subunit SecG
MTTLLITLHVLSCIVLILVVLLQAGRGADMGAAFGGASTPMFGSGSSNNPLARITEITAVLFLATALFLAVSSARRASVFDSTPEPLAATPHAESAPASAEIPASGGAPATPPVAEAKPLTIPATPNSAGSAAANAGSPAASDAAAPAEAAPAAAPADAAPATPPAAAPAAAPPAE